MDFGKNRVQYEEFTWTFYDYGNYQVYFYEGGKDIANYVSKSVKKNLEDIEKFFDYKLEGKPQFIVYNKQSDFKQSNLGLSTEEQYNTGGVTHIVGSKIILYFEGDHQKLEQQIRSGLAEIIMNQMLYGGSLKDVLRSSTLLTLPEWYTKGLISYVASGWNVDLDNRVKDGILSGRYKKFNQLTGNDAIYAGHSMWNYISETYGEAVIANILYMTKISRSIESAYLFVLGESIKSLNKNWLVFYASKYSDLEKSDLPLSQPVPLSKHKQRKNRVYTQLKVNPDGKSVVYVSNELGQYKVWLYDTITKKTTRILKNGQKIDRINDYSYPLLAWHPSGKLFSIITEDKGKLVLSQYTLETKKMEERNITNFEKILDFSYSTDGRKFVMSAVQNGQTDIFVFTAASNAYDQITKDAYDDLNPRFAHNSTEIVFSSNRPDDTLRTNDPKGKKLTASSNKDLFVYNYSSGSPVLKRLTNTPSIDESYPADYMGSYYSFLSDSNGIRNRHIAYFDSIISFIDTSTHYRYIVNSFPISNNPRNIIEQDVNLKANKYAETFYYKGKYQMNIGELKALSKQKFPTLENTYYRNSQLSTEPKNKLNEQLKDTTSKNSPKHIQIINVSPSEEQRKTKRDTAKRFDINNYSFDGEPAPPQQQKQEQEQVQVANSADTTISKNITAPQEEFVLMKQRNYMVNYFTDYLVTQLDNSYLNASYQKFTGGGNPIYLNPGFTGLFKVGMSDLLENYRIVTGLRLSGDLKSNEYFVSYENRLKNLDKQIVLHRQSLPEVSGTKVLTHEAKYVLKWPFSEVASIRGSINLRNDRTVFLATDLQNLRSPNVYETWGGAKLEYIFDNSISKGLNLYNGWRLKIFSEYFRQLNKKETDFVVTGFDIRYYQKIHRDLIWANRISGSTSLGKQKLIYYMGGVDNWLSPKFDNSVNIANDQNYIYQTLATNMRGFYQNARNGNSFVLINSEIRFPVFKYFINKPIQSDFVSNFQIIGFGDIGTAWTGYSPYSEENSLNKSYIGTPGNPITITLKTKKEPVIGGYGFGLRSRVWGYFVRVDWAWGIEDKIILPQLSYLSFSLDF